MTDPLKVQRIFDAVARLPENERSRWLDERCDDEKIRSKVELLLEHYDAPPEEFDEPASQHFTEALAPEPKQIEQYLIIRKVGEGGMGIVYEAEQDSPKRRVALKIIRPGFATPQLLRRFEFEAQVLGRLDHRGIAQIHEAGSTKIAGTTAPFFAMEFVDGEPLDVHVRKQALGLLDRLELIARVCDAVHHAHQKGILHRDLKPANILIKLEQTGTDRSRSSHSSNIDTIGQPKILDFGVARATDSDLRTTTLLTNVGQIIGTLAYMSPEQIEGPSDDLDTRCDVYALGVILYGVLANELPHDVAGKPVPEAARIVVEETPTRLGAIDSTWRGDIETIVAKAMDVDRDQRYSSAAELADDIRRHLRDEPIIGRPPSMLYQARKFARRNKILVRGIAATFLALLLGLIGISYLLLEVTKEKDEVQRAHDRAEALSGFQSKVLDIGVKTVKRGLADGLRSEHEQGLNELKLSESHHEAVTNAFEDSLSIINITNLARGVLSAAIAERARETIDDGFTKDPVTEADLRVSVGKMFRSLGMYEDMVAEMQKAQVIYREHLGDTHLDTLRTIRRTGTALKRMGFLEQAETQLVEALEGFRIELGLQARETLKCQRNVCDLLLAQHKLGPAESCTRELLELMVITLGDDDRATLSARSLLGVVLLEQGRPEEALGLFKELLEWYERVSGEDHTVTLVARNNLMSALYKFGMLEEAEPYARDCVASFARLKGDDHPSTIRSVSNLARVVMQLGKLEEAEELLRGAYEASKRALNPEAEVRVKCTSNFIDVLIELDRPKEAEVYARELLAVHREMGGAHVVKASCALEQLGITLINQEQFSSAETAIQECLDIRLAIDPNHWETNRASALLGASLAGQRRFEEAESLMIEPFQVLLAARDELPPVTGDSILTFLRSRVIALYEAWGKPGEAERWRSEK